MEKEHQSFSKKMRLTRLSVGNRGKAPEGQGLISTYQAPKQSAIVPETPAPFSAQGVLPTIQPYAGQAVPMHPVILRGRDAAQIHLVEEQCRRFCLSLFFRAQDPVNSLGVTSSIPGEGKSFIATVMAQVLANDSPVPIILLECNWENADLHNYFGLPARPGIAEWLRKECTEQAIRYRVSQNLTIIPAGDGHHDAVRLLQQIRKRGILDTFAHHDELLIVDLPSVISTSYSIFAAGLVDALALVVQAGLTPDNLIADACSRLNGLPVEGIILNQVKSHSRLPGPAREKP